MATLTTGCLTQTGLVEGIHLDQLRQLHLLNQQLGDPVATPDTDRLHRIEVDQRHLDLAAIAGVDRTGAVHDRKTYARSQTGPGMNQADHAVRDSHRDTGWNQAALPGGQLDVLGAVQINSGITVVGAAGHR